MSTRNARTPYRAPHSVLRREPEMADQSVDSGLQRELASRNASESGSERFFGLPEGFDFGVLGLMPDEDCCGRDMSRAERDYS